MAEAGHWILETSTSAPGSELCNELRNRLESTNARCVPDALETYSGFTSPRWEDLNPKLHLDLVAKLLAYRASGADLFFRQPMEMDRFRVGAAQLVEQGGELQVWHTRLLSNYGDNAEAPTPAGDQTVVRLIEKLGSSDPHADCPGKSTKNWIRSNFIVLPDLSGPDPRVGQGTAYALRIHQPVIYKGSVVFIASTVTYVDDGVIRDGQADVFEDFRDTGLEGGMCSFKFSKRRSSPTEH